MKIVTLEELGNYSQGTIFSDDPCDFLNIESLYRLHGVIRDDSGQVIDFFYSNLLPAYGRHKEYRIGDGDERWGIFEMDAKFLIYEPNDIIRLVTCLTNKDETIITRGYHD